MYSKSLFGNKSDIQKSIINPINIPFTNNELLFTSQHLSALNKIHTYYTNPLSTKSFCDINDDYLEYLKLYSTISNLEISIPNKSIKLLLKITLEGLSGAINYLGISRSSIHANIQNMILTKKLKAILQHKNETCVITGTENNYILSKTFTLAPIYSYYITIFGIPDKNSGFNQSKIKALLPILIKYNINPYS